MTLFWDSSLYQCIFTVIDVICFTTNLLIPSLKLTLIEGEFRYKFLRDIFPNFQVNRFWAFLSNQEDSQPSSMCAVFKISSKWHSLHIHFVLHHYVSIHYEVSKSKYSLDPWHNRTEFFLRYQTKTPQINLQILVPNLSAKIAFVLIRF